MLRSPLWSALLFILILLPLAGCGQPEGELKVLKRREPRTLLRQGSALTEAEAARREQEAESARVQTKARQELLKTVSRLDGARDVDAALKALTSLEKLGPVAQPFIGRIEPWFKHDNADVRAAALAAWLAVDTRGARQAHREALQDESEIVRRRAVALWAQYHADNLGTLLPLLEDDDPRVQYAVLEALTASKPDRDTLNRIALMVEDMNGTVANAAFSLILAHRKDVKDFDTMVELLLDHQDETTRLRCAETLRRQRILNQRLAEKVACTALEDPSESVREACYLWLKDVAPLAPPALDPAADDETRYSAQESFDDYLARLKGVWKQ